MFNSYPACRKSNYQKSNVKLASWMVDVSSYDFAYSIYVCAHA